MNFFSVAAILTFMDQSIPCLSNQGVNKFWMDMTNHWNQEMLSHSITKTGRTSRIMHIARTCMNMLMNFNMHVVHV